MIGFVHKHPTIVIGSIVIGLGWFWWKHSQPDPFTVQMPPADGTLSMPAVGGWTRTGPGQSMPLFGNNVPPVRH